MKEGERESAELWALPMGQETTVTVLPSCCCSGRAPPPEIPVNLPGRVGTSTLRLLDCALLCCCSRRRRSQSAPDAGKELRNLQRVPRRWGSALAGRNGDVTDVAGPCPAGGGFKREGGCSVLCCSGRSPRAVLCSTPGEKELLPTCREWDVRLRVLLVPPWNPWTGWNGSGAPSGRTRGSAPPRSLGTKAEGTGCSQSYRKIVPTWVRTFGS